MENEPHSYSHYEIATSLNLNFKDIGIQISRKPLKENMAIITVLTENHGLYSCIIWGSSKQFGSVNQQKVIVDFFGKLNYMSI